MFPPLSDLVAGLRSIGGQPLGLVWGAGLVGVFWSLYLWSRVPPVRAAERCAGWAAVLLAAGLLLRLGDALLAPPAPLAPWQWGLALLILPWLLRFERAAAIAAMGMLLSLAAVLAGISGWWLPAGLGAGLMVSAGGALWGVAVVLDGLLRKSLPPAPAPPPVDEQALQQRLDSDEAGEAADKYTRE